MGNATFDAPFFIRRKRNAFAKQFLVYLDGRESDAAEWPDSEDTAVDPTATDMLTAPFGYLPRDGAEYLSGNLDVDAATITAFTIGVVICRDEMTNNEGVVYGLFGSTHYPRIYFVGTTLHAEIKLDGNVKSITVANVDTHMEKGQPHFIVFRGSASTGIEVLIDGTVRGTQADTGTDYDVGAGDFKLAKDTNLSYFQKGALRLVAALACKFTDSQLLTWRTMLEYEGYFDIWRDNFAKWIGTQHEFTSAAPAIADSPYVATLVESD